MANNEVKASIVVDLDEKGVVVGARNITNNVDQMTRKMINNTKKINGQFGAMNKSMGNSSSQLNAFTKRMVGMYGGVQGIKRIWEFNDGLREMQRNLGLNTDEIDRYKNALFDIQWQYGVNKTAFGAYINEVAKGVKTYEELEEKAKLGAIAMAGLGLDAKQAADLMRAMEKANIQNPEAMMNTFANIGQNRNGRFGGNEIATGTMEVMKSSGLSQDKETMTQAASMLQALSEGGEDVGDAVGQLVSIISDLNKDEFRKFYKGRLGADVFDVKDNQLVLKDLPKLLE